MKKDKTKVFKYFNQSNGVEEFDKKLFDYSVNDWYRLLHYTQGDLEAMLRVGIILEYNNFIYDSLFCEWAYIINLDTGKLEIYKGFQSAPHSLGRYSVKCQEEWSPSYQDEKRYYPCALVAEHSIQDIPENWLDEMLVLCKEEEED